MALIEFEDSGEYKLLPEGVYTFEVRSVEQTTSSKGSPQLKIGVVSVDGPEVDRHTSIWYSLLSTAGWRLARLLDAAGVDYERADKAVRFDTDDLLGRTFVCDVTIGQTNTGKERNEFGNERPPQNKPRAQAPAAAPAHDAAPARAGDLRGESMAVNRTRRAAR